MTVPSARFALPLLGFVLLAAFPVWKGRLAPSQVEDCADPEALYDATRIDPGTSVDEHLASQGDWGLQGVEGQVAPNGRRQAPLVFRLIRGWGLAPGFLSPTGRYHLEADRHELDWIDSGGTRIPVHLARQTIEHGTHFAAYFYAYGGEPVSGAFWTRVFSSPTELVTGSRPMTLFMVAGSTGRLYEAGTRQRALDWLAAAWTHYRTACAP